MMPRVIFLVNAGEGDGLDVEAGFLADFAAQPVVDGLAELEDAAGRFPAVVVGALDEQGAAVVVGDDAGYADRPSLDEHTTRAHGIRQPTPELDRDPHRGRARRDPLS
jgi:hypothetical protein